MGKIYPPRPPVSVDLLIQIHIEYRDGNTETSRLASRVVGRKCELQVSPTQREVLRSLSPVVRASDRAGLPQYSMLGGGISPAGTGIASSRSSIGMRGQ